jgi:20S proteasome alpha/beta subunit
LVNLFQIYSTIVGVRCKNGIVLGTEKIVVSKMMVAGTDKRTFNVTTQSGCVSNITIIMVRL